MDRAADVVRRAPFGENPLVGERGASTQRRIPGAALEVFAERGYHDARVELITEAAGCSRPAFYQYFSSKDDLFWRLAGHLANDMGEHAESIGVVSPDDEGLSHLRSWLDSFIDLCILYDPILTGYPAAARERRPDAKDLRVIGNRVGVAIVKGAAPDRSELYRPPLTNTMVGLIIRSIYYWQLGLGPLTRARFVDGLAQTIHRLLHGAIAGVNVAPVTRPPKRRPRKWPEFPAPATTTPSFGREARRPARSCSRRAAGCSRSAGTTRRAWTTSSRPMRCRTAASTATSRTRTTSSTSSPSGPPSPWWT